MLSIKTVTVLGANGTMGQNIAGIFASFGGAKVFMVCRTLQSAKAAKSKAAKSVIKEAINKNLIAKTYEDLEECLSASDLVFESVAENIDLKKHIYQKIAKYIKPDTIIGTGTSGLSVNILSKSFDENIRRNFLGIHMYNPPYNMTLCEVIVSEDTDITLFEDIKEYLEKVLYRKVVQIDDQPAFMGNRIGFQFINEALQYAEHYKENGGIDYIDGILGGFTGRSMAPLVTSDFVGLDVHKAIVDNIYNNTCDYAHDTFVMPEYAKRLIVQNKLGRKTGAGLYRMKIIDNGQKTLQTYDILTGKYRKKVKYNLPFAEHMKEALREGDYTKAFRCLLDDVSQEAEICIHFLVKYVIYSILTTKAIGENIHSADHVMAMGFNWIPPLAVIDGFCGVDAFKEIVITRMPSEYLSKINIADILEDVPPSSYDFKSFFKVK